MFSYDNEDPHEDESQDEFLEYILRIRNECISALRGDGESEFMTNILNEEVPILQEACRSLGYQVDILPLAFGKGKTGIIENASAVYRKAKINHLPLWDEFERLRKKNTNQ